MIHKIQGITTTVREILTEFPKTRNSDRLLILKVWARQNPYLRHKGASFIEFSHGFLGEDYADTESIRRARQKIQAEEPALRGTNTDEKHRRALEVTKEINAK